MKTKKRKTYRALIGCAVAVLYLLPFIGVRSMAGMFLKIEGIEGESQDSKHKEWIEVLSFGQGVSMPIQGSGPSRTTGDSKHKDISVTKWIDKATPNLMLSSCNGRVFPKVEIDWVSSSDGNTNYMKYTLKDVIVTSVQTDGDTGERPSESLTLNYTEVEWTYIVQDGATGGTAYSNTTSCIVR